MLQHGSVTGTATLTMENCPSVILS